MSERIQYQSGNPTQTGVYACRVEVAGGLFEDKFLLWYAGTGKYEGGQGKWYYLRSDQRYRGNVPLWLGPLPRTRLPNTEEL